MHLYLWNCILQWIGVVLDFRIKVTVWTFSSCLLCTCLVQCSELSALTRSPHTCSQAYIHKLCKCAFVFYFYLFIVVVVVFNIGKYAKKNFIQRQCHTHKNYVWCHYPMQIDYFTMTAGIQSNNTMSQKAAIITQKISLFDANQLLYCVWQEKFNSQILLSWMNEQWTNLIIW
jgi:hypothetical protein